MDGLSIKNRICLIVMLIALMVFGAAAFAGQSELRMRLASMTQTHQAAAAAPTQEEAAEKSGGGFDDGGLSTIGVGPVRTGSVPPVSGSMLDRPSAAADMRFPDEPASPSLGADGGSTSQGTGHKLLWAAGGALAGGVAGYFLVGLIGLAINPWLGAAILAVAGGALGYYLGS